MARELTDLVLYHYPRSGMTKLVLWVIADHCNRTTYAATLSRARVMALACTRSADTCSRAVATCEADGVLRVERHGDGQGGHGSANAYTIDAEALKALPRLVQNRSDSRTEARRPSGPIRGPLRSDSQPSSVRSSDTNLCEPLEPTESWSEYVTVATGQQPSADPNGPPPADRGEDTP